MKSQDRNFAQRSRAVNDPNLRAPERVARAGASSKLGINAYADTEMEFPLQKLTMLSVTPLVRIIRHWWLTRAENHYLICADVERERAREAHLNVAYYQKQAALARSARH